MWQWAKYARLRQDIVFGEHGGKNWRKSGCLGRVQTLPLEGGGICGVDGEPGGRRPQGTRPIYLGHGAEHGENLVFNGVQG